MMRLWDKKHKHDRLTVFPSGEYSGNLYGVFIFTLSSVVFTVFREFFGNKFSIGGEGVSSSGKNMYLCRVLKRPCVTV